jgi:hypothetical protein
MAHTRKTEDEIRAAQALLEHGLRRALSEPGDENMNLFVPAAGAHDALSWVMGEESRLAGLLAGIQVLKDHERT